MVRSEADELGIAMSKKWYVVHAYSGFEKSVQRTLQDRIRRAGMEDKFGQILVPVEEVVEMKSGQKAISERKFFPGYSIGAGAMTVSHLNDSFFWVVAQFSEMDTAKALKSQTVSTFLQGLTGIILVMLIGWLFL